MFSVWIENENISIRTHCDSPLTWKHAEDLGRIGAAYFHKLIEADFALCHAFRIQQFYPVLDSRVAVRDLADLGAHFLEVRVDSELGSVRVTRVVTGIGAGRIMNEKTAMSQITGGVVGGIGQALMEETLMDHRMGRIVNASLGEYHVPVNADIGSLEAFFVEERDEHVNPLGAKGIGEVSYVGVAAAVANAVFHATGKRIRHLPITLDKLL